MDKIKMLGIKIIIQKTLSKLFLLLSIDSMFLFSVRKYTIFLLPFLCAPIASAHHSVAGQFDMSAPVEWTGVISDIDWINPHSYIYLDVNEPDGSISTWRLETLPTAVFRKAKITKQMILGGGQQVTISGLTARDGSKHLGYIIRINYADGHFYQLSADLKR